MRIGAFLVVIWLLIGAFASYQRGYFSNDAINCAQFGTVALTVLVGPLNYVGLNPKIDCSVPQPSK